MGGEEPLPWKKNRGRVFCKQMLMLASAACIYSLYLKRAMVTNSSAVNGDESIMGWCTEKKNLI